MLEKKAHLFICVNDRGPSGKESCAQKGGQKLKDDVKALCQSRGLKTGVRINNSGCLGPCERGITAVLYPQGQWILDNKADDAQKLVAAVEEALKE